MRGKENLVRWFLRVLFILVVMSTTTAQTTMPEPSGQSRIIYVDDDAAGFNIGTSWVYAINSLQDALLLAYFYEKPVEIRVAEGTYTPDKGLGIMPGDPSVSFELMNGVTIKGGYASNLSRSRGRTDVRERDINQYKSILSGDLNSDDGLGSNNIKENSYHVVTASEIDETAVLDGFTITGSNFAYGPTSSYNHSGGMYNNNSSPTWGTRPGKVEPECITITAIRYCSTVHLAKILHRKTVVECTMIRVNRHCLIVHSSGTMQATVVPECTMTTVILYFSTAYSVETTSISMAAGCTTYKVPRH
jgi:hypothetical protein